MPVISTLADIRDVVVIVYGIIGIIFFFIGVIILLVIGFSARGLLRMVREMLNDSVKPTMASLRDAADTVRGTTDFVSRTAVTPIVKTYGAFAGARRGLGVLSNLAGRRK
jgi:hypothetical protein